MRRYRVPGAAGFERASASERRQADRFLFDLLGRPQRVGRALPRPAPAEGNEAEWSASPDLDGDDLAETTFTPEDLAPDMAGLEFVLHAAADVKVAGASTRHPAGTVVTVVKWDNGKDEIEAKIGGASATVGKELIAPKATMYRATITTVNRSYEIAVPLYAANLKARRDDLLNAKATGKPLSYKQLNKQLILEMQLNRLDPLLGRWSAYYDTLIGEPKGWKSLAPGWVKSMMVQESTVGSAGKYLVENAGEPWKTRFNVLQAIDSWGFQQYLMMEELEPGLLKKEGLDKIMDDRLTLAKEFDKLDAKTTRSTAEEARHTYLKGLKYMYPAARRVPNWWHFFTAYPDVDMKPKRASSAPKSSTGGTGTTGTTGTGGTSGTAGGGSTRKKYLQVVKEFLEGGTPKRKYDYSFWIRTGVRWLFEKRMGTPGWSDAVRAFNGEGGRAEFYRAVVLTRARAAAAMAGIDEEIWGGFECSGKKKTPQVFQLCPFEQSAHPCEPRC